jgi:hypothetical protein
MCDKRALKTPTSKETTPVNGEDDDDDDDQPETEATAAKKTPKNATGNMPSDPKISNYEIQRDENIARNKEMLQELDVGFMEKYGVQAEVQPAKEKEKAKEKGKKEKKTRTKKPKATEPRRSSRNNQNQPPV